jgi:hypothetical protein
MVILDWFMETLGCECNFSSNYNYLLCLVDMSSYTLNSEPEYLIYFQWNECTCDLDFLMFLCLEIDKFSCDFEDGICQWTQDSSDDYDWTRNRASTQRKGTGPVTDHTEGLDKCLYFVTIDQEGKPLDSTWRALFNVRN